MGKILYKRLSFKINGVLFRVHNKVGRYAREKQYANVLEEELKKEKIPYKREMRLGNSGNIVDFLIADKIIVEIKAKRFITKDDYYQIQRYLQYTGCKLGLLVNFRNRYLKPIRVIRIDSFHKLRYNKNNLPSFHSH